MRSGGPACVRVTNDGETPCCWFFIRLGNHSTDDADFSLVGIQRLDIICIPELDAFFFIGIVVLLTQPLAVEKSERFLERLMGFLLEDDEASIAVPIQLSHQRPVGIKSVKHDGVDKAAVSACSESMRRRAAVSSPS